MPDIIVIAHNIRSTHNIGSIFRTCDGFGVQKLIISGYTPYPHLQNDVRLPHIAEKLTGQIHKTALGAELTVPFEYQEVPDFEELRTLGYVIVGLEQDSSSIELAEFSPPHKIALLLGEEVEGIAKVLRDNCDAFVEIPMHGQKESFNVSVAAGIALYALSTNR